MLAWLAPSLGAPEGPLRAGILSKAGVMVIFFLQGLSLRTGELASGVRNYRLHGFVQGWIFVGSGLVLLLIVALWRFRSASPDAA